MVKIITDGFPEDGSDEVLLDEITCKYIQNADCTENRDECQELILSSRDGGGGKFINIKTESWSITGENFEEDIIPILKDFKHRMNECNDNSGFALQKILETSNS